MDAVRAIEYISSMQMLSGKLSVARLSGILNPQYQVHGYCVQLTARRIFAIEPTGQIDFGGNEYAAAGRIEIASQRLRREDRYRWWRLTAGAYFVECNESVELAENEMALIEPDDRLLRAGAWHVPFYVRGRVPSLQLLLYVGAAQLRIKENARLTLFRLFRISEGAETESSTSKSTAQKQKMPKRRKIPVLKA